ncbi:dihydrolipoyllysine-residue acetyltransferase component 4 of pyruvate dehydrogenase complex, chloroplastic-like [Helianthus annuus]|uniref:dihydrolipoyllysine-residue acetyltransferase component 4 of pyruvate dehydrogenase complex, chloroplastic-like n=1 Tax=Helianthus annuus TaxID=4232 RepID=UPI00165313DF|nr:dihydrolipoyllysine-residue acetyltransferase component 4 of pyruvate dehydrogenase complex, chloroplastic-like [Helianthus annuus]XP_035833316.1 dihydrolipoyllysine-residue acetyltransferase component 4 of pyruvate dehydrogenase complex, chloroplastic-like [Helianthus annuus]
MFGMDRFDATLPPGQGAIMADGASKPTPIADKDGYFSVKSQMLDHEELFETISQALISLVDRDCLSGWGGNVYIV